MYCLQGQNGNGKSHLAYFQLKRGASGVDTPSDQADVMTGGSVLCQVAVPVPIRRGQMQIYDYFAGPAAHCAVGSIVKAPLAGREIWGVVTGHDQKADIAPAKLKTVISLADVPALSDETLRFLQAVSRWTLAPFGSVMRLMLNTPSAFLPPPEQTVYHLSAQLPDGLRLTPQRQRVLSFLQSAPPLPLADLSREVGVSASVIKGLADDGALNRSSQPRLAPAGTNEMPPGSALCAEFTLTSAQQQIADGIDTLAGAFSVHLIDGITGSGKTEVYFDQVVKQVAAGKQVLILLPEIALTTSWKARFEKWFGYAPHIWHSSVSAARRKSIWRQAISGQPMVVAGARSALFLPFSSPGLIIVDEEHDGSYKQEDHVSYQARDMAILRAKIHDVPVLLASATPSLESWTHAGCGETISAVEGRTAAGQTGWYHWPLKSRYGSAHLPDVSLIDLRLSKPEAGKWLSAEVMEAVTERLEAGEQSLLFLNRRGYAPMTVCGDCGHRLTCHQCDSLLVTHKLAGRVQCHFCGIGQPITQTCPSCETTGSLRAVGPGVERLYEELSERFPEARIAVLSSDTVQTSAADALFAAIQAGEIDILIGTQMAAKGHHFPFLTLVGVVDADLGLGGGDLRAAERTYQLLWQVAGRSGRGERPGKVMIQTFQPHHPVMQALVVGPQDNPNEARDKFMQAEAEARQAAGMPPFGRLAALILSGSDIVKLEQAARHLNDIRPQFAKVDIFGPAQAPLSRVRGQFRIRFLVRTERQVAIGKIVDEWLSQAELPSGVRLVCDIDPYSFL